MSRVGRYICTARAASFSSAQLPNNAHLFLTHAGANPTQSFSHSGYHHISQILPRSSLRVAPSSFLEIAENTRRPPCRISTVTSHPQSINPRRQTGAEPPAPCPAPGLSQTPHPPCRVHGYQRGQPYGVFVRAAASYLIKSAHYGLRVRGVSPPVGCSK